MYELKDDYTTEAAEHFNLNPEEVLPKHLRFIKDQLYAENYGFMGVPKRKYQVHDNGSVEFIN
jgi:hypothetical protein